MAELVFVKLGGSLITDKTAEAVARPEVILRLGQELRRALDRRPGLQLLIGHGSGSFGHVVAKRYDVQTGVSDWFGYAQTSAAALRLNRIVSDGLLEAGVPVISIQPSASARAQAGELREMATYPIEQVLRRDLLPLVFGDVALDDAWGTTILSTEAIFGYLAPVLRPQRMVLVGEVEGVYSADPHRDPSARLIPIVRAAELQMLVPSLGGSHAVDVTGGMRSKVLWMARLVRAQPGLRVCLLSGLQPGLLERALTEPEFNPGTVIL